MAIDLYKLRITEYIRSTKLEKRIEKQITQIVKRHSLKGSSLDDVFEDVKKEVVNNYTYYNPYIILHKMCEIHGELHPYIPDENERHRFYTFWIEMGNKRREVHPPGVFIDKEGHIKHAKH